ncbi:MAG TPA: TetR/AcrR family transcriptional regulator C-terminal domain-containing protein, partial [Jiangellaceae bacterium]|nr:TetR/AcrR family transcriptional regulator C-terminal domain-containing protein [Jiangellaceae bacterium]
MRARFTLAEIQTAALRIVDVDGLTGLSMRSLAAALGTGPMTLYNYLHNRDELEALVAEAVIAEVEVPSASDDWVDDVRAIATAIWQAVRNHPNAIPLVLTRRTKSTSSYAVAEHLIETLSRGGLADTALLTAFRAVLSLVMGSAQVELAGPLAGADRVEGPREVAGRIGALAGDEYHRMAALSKVSQRSSG